MALLTGTGGGFADRGAVGPASQCGEHLVPVESGMSWGWEQPFGLTSPRMLKFCSLEQWCYSLRYRPSAVTGWGGCSVSPTALTWGQGTWGTPHSEQQPGAVACALLCAMSSQPGPSVTWRPVALA